MNEPMTTTELPSVTTIYPGTAVPLKTITVTTTEYVFNDRDKLVKETVTTEETYNLPA